MEVQMVVSAGEVLAELSEVDISELQAPSEEALTEQIEEPVVLYEVPLSALRCATLNKITNQLNSEKLFFTEDKKYHRDWRGLMDIIQVPKPQDSDKAGQILAAWGKSETANLGLLMEYLNRIERWDIVDDYQDQIEEDARNYKSCWSDKKVNYDDQELEFLINNKILTFDDKKRYRNGEPLVKYNSLIIYPEAKEDLLFAEEMKNKLIKSATNEAECHVCMKLDLLPGMMEKDAILGLIAERCSYVIVIITPNYGLDSQENQFIVNFAQAFSVDQNRRVIIPCIYGLSGNIPLPKELMYLSKLDYNRELSMKNYDFWGRLKTSIATNVPQRYEEESYKSRKARLINALPMKELYENMKEVELRREDGGKLIEEVEREGETHHKSCLIEIMKENDPSGSSEEDIINGGNKPKISSIEKICKKFTKLPRLFVKSKPKKSRGKQEAEALIDERKDKMAQ